MSKYLVTIFIKQISNIVDVSPMSCKLMKILSVATTLQHPGGPNFDAPFPFSSKSSLILVSSNYLTSSSNIWSWTKPWCWEKMIARQDSTSFVLLPLLASLFFLYLITKGLIFCRFWTTWLVVEELRELSKHFEFERIIFLKSSSRAQAGLSLKGPPGLSLSS